MVGWFQMNAEKAAEVVAQIRYKNWRFRLEGLEYVQVCFGAADPDKPDGQVYEHHGRKWKLSPHMTSSELVQTCLLAVLQAEEHEAREKFRYKGYAIFGPHYDVEALVNLCDAGGAIVQREPALKVIA